MKNLSLKHFVLFLFKLVIHLLYISTPLDLIILNFAILVNVNIIGLKIIFVSKRVWWIRATRWIAIFLALLAFRLRDLSINLIR